MTTAQIISIARISQYLTTSEEYKAKYLRGTNNEGDLARLLYTVRKNVEWLYNVQPDDASLAATGSYLYSLCGYYALQAMAVNTQAGGQLIDNSMGLNIKLPIQVIVGGTDAYSPVAGDTAYSNLRIKATDRFLLFSTSAARYLKKGIDYTKTASGFQLTRTMDDTEEFTILFY
jgi:hypothetical protein